MSVEYSVIVPAYNEEEFLLKTLTSLNTAMAGIEMPGELIVVDNNSSDATREIARHNGAHVVFESLNQISRARNKGASAAIGKYLIFVDADTTISQKLLLLALNNMKEGGCCGGGAQVALEGEVPKIAFWVLNFWNWLSMKRQLAAGCFIYCMRDAFEDVNGFSEQVYASEEIWLSRAIRLWGKPRNRQFLIIETEKALTSPRKLEWYSVKSLLFYSLPILLCPPLVRVQYFCRTWYTRPS